MGVLARLTGLLIPLLLPLPTGAVSILDSTWSAEGGAAGREWAGFGAHLRLAAEPQFRPVLAFATEGKVWGGASGTWIGNDDGHAYILTAAHIYDPPGDPAAWVVRGPDGKTLRGDRLWLHPDWNGDAATRTGFDIAILRLPQPLKGAGEPPALYAGSGEAGKLITFVGFGARGIGSVGQQSRFYRGSDKAAAQGVVDQWVPVSWRRSADKPDLGNYLGIYLPKEDGSKPNPWGGADRPATPLVGLLGSGDSGGSAWMRLGSGWAIVGVACNGTGKARYGEKSWFARVAPHRSWILGIFPGAHFAE